MNYYTKCKLYINNKELYSRWDVSTSFNEVERASGEFTVVHDDSGLGAFTV
jgi:hypothetical protein